MADRYDFETRLEQRLRTRASIASRPFDAAAIARQVVAASDRRRRFASFDWPSTRPALGWLIIALLLIASLGAVTVMSGFLRARQPQPLPLSLPGNGLIAVSANPWDFGGGENGDIYVVSEGNPPRRIIGSIGDDVAQACPRFSPDGLRLAFGEARASGPVRPSAGRGRSIIARSLSSASTTMAMQPSRP